MVNMVFKTATVIMGMLWIAATLHCASATDGPTVGGQPLPFNPSRFLKNLGLDSIPVPDRNATIPEYMLGLYRQSSMKRNLLPGVAVRSIKLEAMNSTVASSFRYVLSALNPEEKLVQATVRLTNVFGPHERPSLLLTSGDTSGPATRVHPQRGWNNRREVVFTVTEAVARCRADNDVPDRKCSIVLEVAYARRPEAAARRGLDAILVVMTRHADHQGLHRVARAAPPRRLRPLSERLCQRREMYVDFQDIGWSAWIIAPGGYQAHSCSGSCPFPISEHLNTTNHAIIQTLAHSAYPKKVSSTCCVPVSFAPISMLYYDAHNNTVLRQYEDMIIDACGCR